MIEENNESEEKYEVEDKSERKGKKEQNYKIIFDVIVSVTSIVSVFLVLLTLQEMKTERENSYAPCFVLESNNNQAVWGEWDSADYKRLLNVLDKDEDSVRLIDSKIILHNIGIGAAKNLTVTCDMSFLEDYFAFVNSSNKVKWYIDKVENPILPKFVVYNNFQKTDPNQQNLLPEGVSRYAFDTYTRYSVSIPYVLSSDESPVSINFEPCFYAGYIITTTAEYNKSSWALYPPFIIELKYEDIHGNEYLQRFEVSVESLLERDYSSFIDGAYKNTHGFVQYHLVFNEVCN